MSKLRVQAMVAVTSLSLACASCQREVVVNDRPVRLNTLAACPVAVSRAYSVVYAWGDFEPRSAAAQLGAFFLRDGTTTFDGLPEATRTLVVDVSQPSPASAWLGVGHVGASGPVDVLLLPRAAACALSSPMERRTGAALAALDATHVLVAGGMTAAGQVPRTYLVDLARGTVGALATGLGARRASPTITAFGGVALVPGGVGALVAGGADPASGAPLGTAEIYSRTSAADDGDFLSEKIPLNDPRAEHGAVVLASGETLLVGGRGAAGLLATMEVVDPASRRARTGGLAALAVPRRHPAVLRLASGEILVAGGEDAQGAPVSALEWFSPDASRPTLPRRDLVASRRSAFVPLAGGGALAVVAPDAGAPTAAFKSVWVIGADGSAEPQISAQDLDQVHLFPASDGAPVLFTGRRWLRWQPWFGAFQQMLDAPEPTLGAGGPDNPAIAAPDPGLAVWLEERGDAAYVRAFRHGARDAYAPVTRPLLVKDPTSLAPDRAPSSGAFEFEVARGLLLAPSASAFLPDVSFMSVTIELRVAAAAPLVVLRGPGGEELAVGGAGCPEANARDVLIVARSGGRVTYQADGGAVRECARGVAEGARVAVGLRGRPGTERSGARNLFVRRE